MSKISYDFDAINNQSLILQLFEIGKLFVDKKTVVFRSKGICMYPCIRPGDILHLETKTLKEINVGDIVVYRRANRLFAHRAIAQINDAGGDHLLARPDNADPGHEEPVADADILGIVAKIERRGKFISSERKTYPPLRRCLYNIDYGWSGFKQRVYGTALEIICFLQRSKIYRTIARIAFFPYYRKLKFSLQVPLNNADRDSLYRMIAPCDFPDLKVAIGKGSVSRAKIFAVINKRNIACMDLTFRPGDRSSLGAHTSVISTKIRYRHSGIEEKLSDYAKDLLKQIFNAK